MGNGVRRFDRKRAAKDAEAAKDNLLAFAQSFVAPIDHRTQGLMPLNGGPSTPGQNAEAIIEAVGQSVQSKQRDTCRGKLDSEWQSIKSGADIGNDARVAVGQLERSVPRAQPLNEQLHGREVNRLRCIQLRRGYGNRKR